MRNPGRAALALLLTCSLIVLAGCGDDSNDGSSTNGSAGAKASPAAVESVAELQQAAQDLARETSFKDEAGTERALKAAETAFAEAREDIEQASPGAEEEIKRAIAEAKEEVERGDVEGASRPAEELLNAANEASVALGGKPSSQAKPATGNTECKEPKTTKSTGLPATFPLPGELTITEVRKDGPTNVVDGYWASGLDEAYEEFEAAVDKAGYQVLFKEKEEHDAEISYKGSNRSGQIALRDTCTEDDTIRVHITNRPE
jgi:hypothetical protein